MGMSDTCEFWKAQCMTSRARMILNKKSVFLACIPDHTQGICLHRMNFFDLLILASLKCRRGMYVIGHVDTLKSSPPWADLIQHCHRMNCLFTANSPYDSILASALAELAEDRVLPIKSLEKLSQGEQSVSISTTVWSRQESSLKTMLQ